MTESEKFYIQKGRATKRSEQREYEEDTEAGRAAAFIIAQIPKEFDVYADCDINEGHLADEIVSACGRWIKYCPQIGWLVWSAEDGRWREKYAGTVAQHVIVHFGELLLEGASESNQGETRFARHILSSAGINNIKALLKHHKKIHIEQEELDACPELLNCKGDLYNLRTGETRRAEPEDLLTKTVFCKASPMPDADMPGIPKQFEEFIKKITSKDGAERPDLALFILYWFGYCLTGDTGAAFFVNFHGAGNNGKSVLLKLMTQLFGDYAAPIPKDIVIENRFASQFNLAGLPGIRLGVLADAPEGRLNMDTLKPITTGDTISAQRKFMKDFAFKSVCKIAVGSNPKLKLKDTGMAIRRRVRLAPFDYTVPDDEIVVNLEERLLEEAPEILALLIFFAKEYYRRGGGPRAFPPCAVVDQASAEYMDSEDLVGRYVKERTQAAPGGMVSPTDLYKDFLKWADGEGVIKKMSKNTFGEHLSTHIQKKKTHDGWHYLDIMIQGETGPLAGDRGG